MGQAAPERPVAGAGAAGPAAPLRQDDGAVNSFMDDMSYASPRAVNLFFAALGRTLLETERSVPRWEGLPIEILARLEQKLSPDELALRFDDLPLRDLKAAQRILDAFRHSIRSDS